MKETAHDCEECIRNFIAGHREGWKKKEFWNAVNLPPVSPVNCERGPHTAKGVCDRCGQADVVSFYRISK